MRAALLILVGIGIGFGAATFYNKVPKQYVRLDGVTLKKSELDHLARAIEMLKDKEGGRAFWRYETDSGALAFECPTNEKCNLEVPARNREQPRELRVTSISATEKVPVERSSPTTTVEARVADSNDLERILKEARPIPNFQNGEAQGWSKVEAQPSGVYDKLSVRNGDIITTTRSAPQDDGSVQKTEE